MLVLSRKIGEEIIVDGNIRIIVNRISGSRVSLAVDAPENVRVMRGELQPQEEQLPQEELPQEEQQHPFSVHRPDGTTLRSEFSGSALVNRVG